MPSSFGVRAIIDDHGGHLDSSASQKAKGAFVRESQYNREFVAFLSLRIHLTLSTKPTSTMRKPEVIGAPACSALPECTHASPCRRCTVPSVCAAQCASSCCNRCGRKVPPPWNSLSLHSSTLKLSSEPSRCNSSCRWPPALHWKWTSQEQSRQRALQACARHSTR